MIHPDQRCECSRRHPTGQFYLKYEACLCGKLIVRSAAERARLDMERAASEKSERRWGDGRAPILSRAETRLIVRATLLEQPHLSQSGLMLEVGKHGAWEWSHSVFQRLVASVRTELGIDASETWNGAWNRGAA